jgi:hypothetical protein
MDHLVTEFSYESMPHHLAERNMPLFADQVSPVPRRDSAFEGIVDPAPLANTEDADRLFAPA